MTIRELPTPCYVIDEGKLEDNLRILEKVRRDTGCKILLAQKAFSCYYFYPLIGTYLDGTTASGLFEARLGYEEMSRENHVFSRPTGQRIWMSWGKSAAMWSAIPWPS